MAPIAGLPTRESRSNHGSPKKQVSGLPDYRDVHMDTAKGVPSSNYSDIRMGTARPFGDAKPDDVRMETARGGAATLRQNKFQPWERQLMQSPEVRRKATVAQLCASFILFIIQVNPR